MRLSESTESDFEPRRLPPEPLEPSELALLHGEREEEAETEAPEGD